MDSIKIANYESANPGLPFPQYRQITKHEAGTFRSQLALRLSLPCEARSEDILKCLLERSEFVLDDSAVVDGFSLCAAIEKLAISVKGPIFINWGLFEVIDEMDVRVLDMYFDDIWYPGPDDVEIFDSSLSWILIVRHDGAVGIAYFEPGSQVGRVSEA